MPVSLNISALVSTSPKYGLPYALYDTARAAPFDACACCGERKAHTVRHHDHFADLVSTLAEQKRITLDANPQTFPGATLCNSCNGLCPRFKAKFKLAPSFFSLTPSDMRAFLAGGDVLEQVQYRYREPFRHWATRLDAWPEMRAAALTRHRPGSHIPAVKPARQIVLDTLDADPALRTAFDSTDLPECHAIACDLLENHWDRAAFHSFAHLIWYTTHKGPANAGIFADAFKKGDLRYAQKVFDRGCA